MSLKTLEEGLIDELKDIYSAEKQLLKALPKMSKKAHHPQLKEALEKHHRQTETHVQRVEEAFEALDRTARSSKCEAMAGLIEEGSELMKSDADPDVLDAMIIASAQKIEHYEIASYGTLCTWADLLGRDDVARPLKQILGEEKEADSKLTQLASQVNKQAMHAA
jgi:ferritin-like metal-binding protein YciE